MTAPTPVEYEGVVYPSEHALCAAHDVDHGAYYARRKRGMSVAEAISTPKRYHRAVVVDGVTYESRQAACRALGVSYDTVKYRLRQRDQSFEEALHPPVRPPSVLELCARHGVLPWTYWARLKRGYSPEQALELEPPPARVPAARRREALKHLYGLTFEEYEALLEAQAGLCKICGAELNPPCVDHCHKTGKARGILCRLCNSGISHLKDDPFVLRRAALYLEQAQEGR